MTLLHTSNESAAAQQGASPGLGGGVVRASFRLLRKAFGQDGLYGAFKRRQPWAAVVVGAVDPCIAMLYVGRGYLALAYFSVELVTSFLFTSALSSGIAVSTLQSALGVVFLPIRLTGMVHAYILTRRSGREIPKQLYARWYVVLAAALFIPTVTLAISVFALTSR